MNNATILRIATRSVAIVCFLWALSDVLVLPTDISGMTHHIVLRHSVMGARYTAEDSYWIRYYSGLVVERLVGVLVGLALGVWFYRGSAGVRRFYDVEIDPES